MRSSTRSIDRGTTFTFKQVPEEDFAALLPGGTEVAETFGYFEAHTYLGSDSSDAIALANKIAGRQRNPVCKLGPENFALLRAAISSLRGVEQLNFKSTG